MRERSSAQGESAAKAPARLPSVLPPALAVGHLSPPAISAVCAPRVHSLGSPLVVSLRAFFDFRLKVSGLAHLLHECLFCWQSGCLHFFSLCISTLKSRRGVSVCLHFYSHASSRMARGGSMCHPSSSHTPAREECMRRAHASACGEARSEDPSLVQQVYPVGGGRGLSLFHVPHQPCWISTPTHLAGRGGNPIHDHPCSPYARHHL